nr:hypothetical protein [Nocardia seriolae]
MRLRPNTASLSPVSGTSISTASMAITRRPASHAPGQPALAKGTATRRNNSSRGSSPSRVRALHNAVAVGICHRCSHDRGNRSPSTSLALTSSQASSKNNVNADTKYTTTRAGINRRRCSTRPVSINTSSTRSRSTTRVDTLNPTRSVNRPVSALASRSARPGTIRRSRYGPHHFTKIRLSTATALL